MLALIVIWNSLQSGGRAAYLRGCRILEHLRGVIPAAHAERCAQEPPKANGRCSVARTIRAKASRGYLSHQKCSCTLRCENERTYREIHDHCARFPASLKAECRSQNKKSPSEGSPSRRCCMPGARRNLCLGGALR